ncbi:MAG: hypothetical protein J6A76_02885 [Oscillospiraceae bacterium]|nr:hypothetical protein [Oscillospiraceae bacterium]
MKKILSAILAVAMIASMSAVAFAAQPTPADPDGVLTWDASVAGQKVELKIGTPDGDAPTVKVEDGKAFYPVVGFKGPYGYFNDDKMLYYAESLETNDYYAPIEYGDTAYYALIQWMPQDLPATGNSDANETKYDGKEVDDAAVFDGANGVKGYHTVVTESETVSSLKIKQDWEEGDELVKSVSIVKKKVCNPDTYTATDANDYSGDDSDDPDRYYQSLTALQLKKYGLEFGSNGMYCYFLAIKYEDSSSYNDSDVVGTITLSKSKDPSVDKMEFDVEVNLDWENSYRPSSANAANCTVDGDGTELEAGKNYALKFEADDEVELTFDNDSYFEVDVSGQSKMLFSYNTDYISRVAAKYPYAELNFWNGNGAKFNRVGQMFLSCEDLVGTQFLYQVTSDGKLKEVPGAEWDDSDEGFYFNTRVLGSYVISDMELDTVEEEKVEVNNTVVAPAPVITNPSTGAIA